MQTIEELNHALDDAIEDGDTAKMEEINQQIHELTEGTGPDPDSLETNVAESEEETADASRSDETDESGKETDDGAQEGEKAKEGEGEQDVDGILTKDGKRVIPYSELEKTRQELADIKQQLEEKDAQQQVDPGVMAEMDKLRRLNAAYEEQMKSHDLEPTKLPEEFRFTEEQLNNLKEYGEVGEFSQQLARQVEWLKEQITSGQQQIAQNQPEGEPSDAEIIRSDPDMFRWAKSDYAWSKAEAIDGYVQTLPEYQGKSFSERKDEVVRRTKIELGEAAPEPKPAPAPAKPSGKTAEEIVQESGGSPTSLSEIGGASARQEASFAEQTEGMSQIDIAKVMAERLDRGASIDDLL